MRAYLNHSHFLLLRAHAGARNLVFIVVKVFAKYFLFTPLFNFLRLHIRGVSDNKVDFLICSEMAKDRLLHILYDFVT
jgi:hypothetical protein